MSGTTATGAGNEGEAGGNNAQTGSRLAFAEGCYFARDANGALTCTWVNGIAVQAVRGASVDYVEPRFHLAVEWANNTPRYLPGADFGRLVAAGTHATLALIVVGMRKVVLSFDGATLNHAEIRAATDGEKAVAVPEATWNLLEGNLLAFNALIDAAPTVLGCNGLSLLAKGHNYDGADGMWARLRDALALEVHVTALALADYEGVLFHDALHPLSIEWKTDLVTSFESALVGHVNGVVLKRMPGTPAGTALVFVLQAMISEIGVVNAATITMFGGLTKRLDWLARQIRNTPLDWCTNFQRANTARNLAVVAQLEPLASLAYGIAKVLLSRRSSVLRSKALVNCAKRHGGHETMGGRIGTQLSEVELDAVDLNRILEAYVSVAGSDIEGFWDTAFNADGDAENPFTDNESDSDDEASGEAK